MSAISTLSGAHRRVTREMVQARTRELALIAGRAPEQVSQVDYEQAKRELTGESDSDRQDAMLARSQAETANSSSAATP